MSATPKSHRVGMGSVYLSASAEAARRGDRRVGTEHLVLALLGGLDPAITRAVGLDVATARRVLDALDGQALAAIGLHLPSGQAVPVEGKHEQFKLTPAARSVFTGLRAHTGGQRLDLRHVMVALLALQPPDPAATLLDRLGVDRQAVQHRLRMP
ncbi:MAG: Clp protease N-terminal domain-containing protein [Actinomycetota bacterium]